MRNKGAVFSFQGTFALVAMLLTGMVMIHSVSNFAVKTVENEKNAEFERKAIFLADSMVKNHNAQNPFLGAAVFDSFLGRVMANAIDLEALRSANKEQAQIAGITVKKIELAADNEAKETIFDYGEGSFSKCFVTQRFVIDWKRNGKALLEVTCCE